MRIVAIKTVVKSEAHSFISEHFPESERIILFFVLQQKNELLCLKREGGGKNEGKKRREGKKREGEGRGEEKSDKLVAFPVHLNLSWFIRPSPPAQSSWSQQYFPPALSTIDSTLNSVLRDAILRTH